MYASSLRRKSLNRTTVETETHAPKREKSRTRKEFPIQITNSVCVGERECKYIAIPPSYTQINKSAQTNSIVFSLSKKTIIILLLLLLFRRRRRRKKKKIYSLVVVESLNISLLSSIPSHSILLLSSPPCKSHRFQKFTSSHKQHQSAASCYKPFPAAHKPHQ